MSGDIKDKIIKEIYCALRGVTSNVELLCIVGSYGETQEHSAVLEALEQFNSKGTCMHTAVASSAVGGRILH